MLLLREFVEIVHSYVYRPLKETRERKGNSARKGKRKKGTKGSKKGKKKKDKDLTPDRTTESLFEELVMNNVIKPHKNV